MIDFWTNLPSCVHLNVTSDENIIFAEVKIEDEIEEKLKIKWKIPFDNTFFEWQPNKYNVNGLVPQWDKANANQSSIARSAPVYTALEQNGINKMTISLSELKKHTAIMCGVREEDAHIYCEVDIEKSGLSKGYSFVIRIDFREIPYYEALKDAEKWWRNYAVPAIVPPSTKDAMYSTWYSFHQNLSTQELIEQCKRAKALGMNSIIIDDGWQTEDVSRGYAYCGDWKLATSKIEDMRALAEAVHSLDMKIMLWFALPFVGEYSKAYERFKDKFIRKGDGAYHCLDPRFSDVREYIVGNFCKAVRDWNLDGLKIDFIDWYFMKEYPTFEGGDFESLEDALEALITQISDGLKAINPDIMIEFRQYYMGPKVRGAANIIRVADCPCNALFNRVHGINLRLLCGDTAVHSDMIMWDKSASAPCAAKQLINSLFCVPQISVRIEELSEAHYNMLKFYMKLWAENKDLLLSDDIKPLHPECGYSKVTACNTQKSITVCYSDYVAEVFDTDKQIVVNGTSDPFIILDGSIKDFDFEVYNCFGEMVDSGKSDTAFGTNKIKVPESGVLILNRR